MKLHYYRDGVGSSLKTNIIFTKREQVEQFNENIRMIMENTRWILDNIDFLEEYQVGWNHYGTKYIKHKCVACGKEYSRKRQKACTCGETKFIRVHYGVGDAPKLPYQTYNKE